MAWSHQRGFPSAYIVSIYDTEKKQMLWNEPSVYDQSAPAVSTSSPKAASVTLVARDDRDLGDEADASSGRPDALCRSWWQCNINSQEAWPNWSLPQCCRWTGRTATLMGAPSLHFGKHWALHWWLPGMHDRICVRADHVHHLWVWTSPCGWIRPGEVPAQQEIPNAWEKNAEVERIWDLWWCELKPATGDHRRTGSAAAPSNRRAGPHLTRGSHHPRVTRSLQKSLELWIPECWGSIWLWRPICDRVHQEGRVVKDCILHDKLAFASLPDPPRTRAQLSAGRRHCRTWAPPDQACVL